MVTASYAVRSVTANGLKLSYQEWGSPSRPPLLLVHGFGVSGHMFDEFAERAQDRYRLIAVDQRGHGDSDWSAEGDYSRDAFVADIEAFRAALGLDRFVLVGHSMGGMNAVAYAARYPHRVRALVLVDIGPEAAKEGAENIARFTRGPAELEFEEFVELAHRFNPRRSIENIRERMRHRLKPIEGGKWTWKFDARFREEPALLKAGSELTTEQSWALFRSVETPTLLVRGAESDVLTQEVADRVAREMAHCRLVVVPGAGHSVPGDNPGDFTGAVRQFIADVDAGLVGPWADPTPPLARMVETHREGRRRPGSMVLLLGAAGLLALAGGAYVVAQQGNRKRSRASAARLESVERARLQALALAEQLSPAPGRRKRVTAAPSLDHAREAAVALLEEIDGAHEGRSKRSNRSTRAKRRLPLPKPSPLKLLPIMLAVVRFALQTGSKKPVPRRRLLAWRG